MPKTEYRLFHQRTAEKIRDEVSRLRDSLLFGSEKKVNKFGKVDITCDIATLEILLSDYILDYENSEESERQLTFSTMSAKHSEIFSELERYIDSKGT